MYTYIFLLTCKPVSNNNVYNLKVKDELYNKKVLNDFFSQRNFPS